MTRYSSILFSLLLLCVYGITRISSFGLNGNNITSLAVHQSARNNFICAGTDGNGVHLWDFNLPASNWENIGLENKQVTALNIQLKGIGPMEYQVIYAGVLPDSDSTLVYYRYYQSQDTAWTPEDSGLVCNPYSFIPSIKSFDFYSHTPPMPLFLIKSSEVYRFWSSQNSVWSLLPAGAGWEILENQFVDLGGMIRDEVIWIGGSNVGMSPQLGRSTDFGDTWQFFSPKRRDNSVTAIGIVPQTPDTVYVALWGEVIKTTDGGISWLQTSLQNVDGTFSSIVINPTALDHVIVGGRNSSGSFLLFESQDGGSSWTTVSPPTALSGISQMATAYNELNELHVYMGTERDGVYRYSIPVSTWKPDNNEPQYDEFQLFPNYPSPFNSRTQIKFSVKAAGNVTLRIYNVKGQLITILIDRHLYPGVYTVNWNGKDNLGEPVSSGLYLYRLQSLSYQVCRKMIYLK